MRAFGFALALAVLLMAAPLVHGAGSEVEVVGPGHRSAAESEPKPEGLPVFEDACVEWIRADWLGAAGESTLVASDYLVLPCQDRLSELSVLLWRTGRTVIMSIGVMGALRCIDKGDEVYFGLRNGENLAVAQDAASNCDGRARLRFGSTVGRHGSLWGQRRNLRVLAEVDVEAVQVSGNGLSVRAQLSSEESSRLKKIAWCLGVAGIRPGSPPLWDYGPRDYVFNPDVMPAVASRVDPVYPPSAEEAGEEGVVLVLVVVGADGMVSHAEPMQGPGALRGSAVAAVKQWRFRPGLVDGNPVPTRMMVPVRFKLP